MTEDTQDEHVRVAWAEPMGRIPVYGLLDVVRAGQRAENGFKAKMHRGILNEVNQLHDISLDA